MNLSDHFFTFFHSRCPAFNKNNPTCQKVGPNDQNQEEIQKIESDKQVTHLLFDIYFKMPMIILLKNMST